MSIRRYKQSLIAFLLLFSFAAFAGCDEDDPINAPEEHFEPEGWVIYNEAMVPEIVVWQTEILNSWAGAPIKDTLSVSKDSLSGYYTAKFLDGSQNVIDSPEEDHYSFGWMVYGEDKLEIVDGQANDYGFSLRGLAAGSADFELRILHHGHVDVKTPRIPVSVK